MLSARVLVVACTALIAFACDRTSKAPAVRDLSVASGGTPVARAGRETIRASQVRSKMTEAGVGAEEALNALLDESLLVQEAQRRGFVASAADERKIDRLIVRTFLEDLERNVTPESVPAAEVEEDFGSHRESFQVPERRRTTHILVQDQGEDARGFVVEILRDLRGKGVDEVFKRYEAGEAEDRGFDVLVEELPPISKEAGFEATFKDAVFEAEDVGPLRKPVRTSYGWHAIAVTEILPGERKTLADVDDEIRNRLAQKGRFEQLVEILQKLEREGIVHLNETGVQSVLAGNGARR